VKMVEMARERGGFDNITLAVVPLGGQLRNNPPEGYQEVAAFRSPQSSSMQELDDEEPTLVRFLGIIFVLSALAVLLAILVMAFVITN